MEPTRLVFKNIPTQAEIDAFVQSMDNCFIDTADCDATIALARNTGTEILTDPVVFMLDSLSALEGKK